MKTPGQSVAIIGSGIAGLTCAYYLNQRYQVSVFEAADYLGGHTHTVQVESQGERAAIDTGFIVFNDRTYPNFQRLLRQLGVGSQPTEMSFSVRNDHLDLEYNGGSLTGLFAQRRNLARPAFWSMLAEIIRFNRQVRQVANQDRERTLGEFLQEGRYSTMFRDNYLLPMVSAIWSMGLADCSAFPLAFFVRFFDNHGLLDLTRRPQWFTIPGGSSSYIEPLTKHLTDRIHLATPAQAIHRDNGRLLLTAGGSTQAFDVIILACHADQALRLLAQPSAREKQVLGAFSFTASEVILHTDRSLLPRRPSAWASWNYRIVPGSRQATLTYAMNILQRLPHRQQFLVSLNQEVSEQQVLARFIYRHPQYTLAAVAAQQQWANISGQDNLHYCGAWWRNGFHEDGVVSALRVVRALGVDP